jgi:very-short-patch-repair endonuclease
VDFAFTDQRIAIEIDGSQHLLPERKAKDDEKDALLIEQG